jgi:HTH-type transcriptional regulator/antitoxin HigA
MRAKRGTPEGDRLEVLVTLVEAWERRHYPLELPDPGDKIPYGSERT